MANKLNESSVRTLKERARNGNVNKQSSWSFDSSDMDELRGGDEGDNWERVENAHLAIETEAEPKTQARFAFPVAKLSDGELTVFRSGVIAAKQRAGQTGDKSIENAADQLLQLLGDGENNSQDNNTQDFADKLLSLNGIEIFRKGIWNGVKFTDRDLEEIVNNFNRVGFTPPVKLGHTKDPSARAFGKVRNLRREGDKLVADFQDVPSQLVDKIKEKAFDAISSELVPNMERNGRKLGKTLAGVALLGAEIPAVDGLKPVSESVQFNEDDDIQYYTLNQEESMPEEEKNNQEEQNQEFEQIKEEKERLEKEVQELKQNTEVTHDLQETKKQLAQIKEERRVERAESLANKVEIPSLRPYMQVFADWATLNQSDAKYTFSEGEQEVTRSPEEVIQAFVDHINNASQWLFQEQTQSGDESGVSGGTDAGEQIHNLTQKRMKEQGEDYAQAFDYVLEQNPKLASEYANS